MSNDELLKLVESVNNAMSKLCGYIYENDLDELSDKIQEALSPVGVMSIENFAVNYETALNEVVQEYLEVNE